jgi:putative hemin transport protein
MATETTPTTLPPGDLLDRYQSLRESEPRLFPRDAARRLGVSEAEILAARTGAAVIRLKEDWQAIISAMPGVGRIMTLARNDWAVHERKGTFEDVRLGDHGGIVLGSEIDLRIRFGEWKYGFAVTDATERGLRQSLQFFDGSGTAIQKIYTQPETDLEAWEALVAQYTAEDQSPAISVAPAGPAAPVRDDSEIDVEALRKSWSRMTDVHQFFGILRRHEVGRTQAFRLAGDEFAWKIGNGGFRTAIEEASAARIPVMIFVQNTGIVQIHTGILGNLKDVGAYFNVLDPDFNLHLLPEGIAETWVVRKPTSDGLVSSVETFDAEGRQISWMFGKRMEGNAERDDWRSLTQKLVADAG